MPLINCKIELKLKYKYCCVLSANGNDNDNDDPDNISFTVKDTKNYMFLLSLYQQKIIKIYQNLLVKNLKDHFFGNKKLVKVLLFR